MKKNGFTLVELVVSIVLVSIVMVSLLTTLLKIRQTYQIVNENSDILVYSSSITRVINSDFTKNNGVRDVYCTPDGMRCEITLGNDDKRRLVLKRDETTPDTTKDVTHTRISTTIKYLDTTNSTPIDETTEETEINASEKESKLLYIRTLYLDDYRNEKDEHKDVHTTDGYIFYSLSAYQTSYSKNNEENVDVLTNIKIKVYDGLDLYDEKYDINLYTSGSYDYHESNGKVYRIEFTTEDATEVGTTEIEERYGVGYYKAGKENTASNRITKIEIPKRKNYIFQGYYKRTKDVPNEVLIIDSTGNIVVSNRYFREDLLRGDEREQIVAKWGTCVGDGYIVKEDGTCEREKYTITLNANGGKFPDNTDQTQINNVEYLVKPRDLQNSEIPNRGGHLFNGFISTTNKKYYDNAGKSLLEYDLTTNSTFNADWEKCLKGTFAFAGASECTPCVLGSFSGSDGSDKCTACNNGKTTSSSGKDSCNQDCSNNAHVKSWVTNNWLNNNTVDNLCIIDECEDGYNKVSNTCVIKSFKLTLNAGSGKFNSNNTNKREYTFNYGQSISSLETPTLNHFDFKGWNPTVPSTMPANDLNLTAKWERPFEFAFTYNNSFDIVKGDYYLDSGIYYITSKDWVIKLKGSGNFVPKKAVSASTYIVGAGGGGKNEILFGQDLYGDDAYATGNDGGAGGERKTADVTFVNNQSYTITIGNGGTADNDGTNTIAFGNTAKGGKTGGGGKGAYAMSSSDTSKNKATSATAGTRGVCAFNDCTIDNIYLGSSGGGGGASAQGGGDKYGAFTNELIVASNANGGTNAGNGAKTNCSTLLTDEVASNPTQNSGGGGGGGANSICNATSGMAIGAPKLNSNGANGVVYIKNK